MIPFSSTITIRVPSTPALLHSEDLVAIVALRLNRYNATVLQQGSAFLTFKVGYFKRFLHKRYSFLEAISEGKLVVTQEGGITVLSSSVSSWGWLLTMSLFAAFGAFFVYSATNYWLAPLAVLVIYCGYSLVVAAISYSSYQQLLQDSIRSWVGADASKA